MYYIHGTSALGCSTLLLREIKLSLGPGNIIDEFSINVVSWFKLLNTD